MAIGQGKSLVGLDIGSHTVQGVEVVRRGENLEMVNVGRSRIEGPGQTGEAVVQLFEQTGFRTRRVATAVSGRSVIVRYVSMMALSDEELRQAITYEADKYIPFDVSEVQLDCQRLDDVADGQVKSDQMKVVLVAVKSTLVNEHVELLRSVGLVPDVIDVDAFALGNAFELASERVPLGESSVRALIDVGASKTNINIVQDQTSYFTREIYIAGNDLTEAIAKRFGEEARDVERMKEDPGGARDSLREAFISSLEDLANEVQLSFDYYENQFDHKVEEVFLSGGSVRFQGMDELLSQLLSLPTRIWDPTSGFGSGYAGGPLVNADLAIACGLAARLRGR